MTILVYILATAVLIVISARVCGLHATISTLEDKLEEIEKDIKALEKKQ